MPLILYVLKLLHFVRNDEKTLFGVNSPHTIYNIEDLLDNFGIMLVKLVSSVDITGITQRKGIGFNDIPKISRAGSFIFIG